ncbi:MAG: hypothetical protein HY912_19740 [Desulfomonile tiedjei]|uniref:Uncharacterized protein n=1 Tax=Desulfomonile tiedjei TaxID=2358 RepID=A0A9D6Z846_9BACT|nr:hypothetical protein [Desulfomonile tiedjei]
MNDRSQKPGPSMSRKIIKSIVAIAIFIFLYDLLPETGRLWIDWFYGKNELFSPSLIVRLGAIFLLLALGYLLGHFGRVSKDDAGMESMDQKHESPRKERT